MTNGFLVPVPHEQLHGTISLLEQRPELPTSVCKVRAVKDIMPLIAYRMCIAQHAPAQLPGHHWPCKPALLNRQAMGAHPKLHHQPQPGNRHGDVKIRLKTQLAWAKEFFQTMQSMCAIWLPWTEPALGTYADHAKPGGADPPCWPGNPVNSRQLFQKMQMGKACPNQHTAS